MKSLYNASYLAISLHFIRRMAQRLLPPTEAELIKGIKKNKSWISFITLNVPDECPESKYIFLLYCNKYLGNEPMLEHRANPCKFYSIDYLTIDKLSEFLSKHPGYELHKLHDIRKLKYTANPSITNRVLAELVHSDEILADKREFMDKVYNFVTAYIQKELPKCSQQ
jgi:hypothetical protein